MQIKCVRLMLEPLDPRDLAKLTKSQPYLLSKQWSLHFINVQNANFSVQNEDDTKVLRRTKKDKSLELGGPVVILRLYLVFYLCFWSNLI